jgi:hypothetical protein
MERVFFMGGFLLVLSGAAERRASDIQKAPHGLTKPEKLLCFTDVFGWRGCVGTGQRRLSFLQGEGCDVANRL